MKLDGNVYPIQFRLHDNRFPNSPRAITLGGGAHRSDLLALGEPGFDPIRHLLSIGYGGPKGLGTISGDQEGNLRSDVTPLLDTNGNRVSESDATHNGKQVLAVGYDSVAVRESIMMRDVDGDDKVLVGHGHMLAAVSTMFNIQRALKEILQYREAVDDGLLTPEELEALETGALAEVNDLYSPRIINDPAQLPHHFPEVHGNYNNLLNATETFTAADWVKFNTSAEANRTVAPNGTATGDLLNDAYSGGDANLSQILTVSGTDDRRYCFSSYLKPGTSRYTGLELLFWSGGTTKSVDVSIDWQDMTFTSSNSLGGILPAPEAPGWYRMWVSSKNNASGNTKVSSVIRPSKRKGLDSTAKGHVYAWGAMLNFGMVPDRYVA